jgi:hypothetical protein
MDVRTRCWSLVLLCSALLGGCASTPSDRPSPLLRMPAFAPPAEPVDPRQALTLSPAMRDFAAGDMARQIRAKGRVMASSMRSMRANGCNWSTTASAPARRPRPSRRGAATACPLC